MTLLPTAHGFKLGHRYGSRSARDHFKDVLDTASFGAAAVISRKDVPPVAAVNATELAELLAEVSPISVLTSVTEGQVAVWLEDGLVHAVGDSFDEASDAFLDALIDYAGLWFTSLRDAPNHAHNRWLALRVALHAGDRDELERAVFGDD